MNALRLGAAGLGRAFMLMLPTFRAHPRVQLTAAADPRPEARAAFEREFGGHAHASVEALCADDAVDAIYLSTPHQFHAAHAELAARHGKHILVEKPMAVTLAECDAMIEAAAKAGVALVVGHSHGFDAPILRTRELIAQGTYGRVRMINALNYTDFLYRPRRPEELDTAQGGGVVWSQGAHQVDVVRLLAGGMVRSVRAHVGAWDAARPGQGAFAAQLAFADGAFASLVYSGYGHFDSDEFLDWIGELGQRRDPSARGATRWAGTPAAEEAAQKTRRTYGAPGSDTPAAVAHNHFGLVIVSCDHADLRPMADGVRIYANDGAQVETLPAPVVPRAEVIDELCDAVAGVRPAVHSGPWGRATLEVCLAIVESARSGRDVTLRHQVPV